MDKIDSTESFNKSFFFFQKFTKNWRGQNERSQVLLTDVQMLKR